MSYFDDEKKPKDVGPLTKHGWEKRRIIKTSVWGGVSFVLFGVWYRVRYLYKGQPDPNLNNANLHYVYQLCCVLLAIAVLVFLHNLHHLVPDHVKAAAWQMIYTLGKKYIGEPLGKINSLFRKVFGLPEKLVGGEDESSFIFDFEGNNLFRKFQSVTNQLRWRDLETNAEKIRFLFIKYFIKLIKSGYKYKNINTPDEVRVQLNLKDDPEKLFILYTGARYSGGRYLITDENVDMAEKLVKKRGL